MSRSIKTNHTTTPLISPERLHLELPLSDTSVSFIEKSRSTANNVIEGKDPRLLLIVGPCSIHNSTAAIAYATRLKALQKRVDDQFFIVMRVHGEKPRTTIGWKGLVYDPALNGTPDLEAGLREMRKLLLTLTEMNLPVSTEFLDPYTHCYLGDLITWGQIGARTSTSQIHRQMASGLSMPIGFKNSVDGDLRSAVNAILAASSSQTYFGLSQAGNVAQVTSRGNPNCHLVLRGSEQEENFQKNAVARASQLLRQAELPPHLFIDCSHGNCRKDHTLQPSVFMNVIDQSIREKNSIRGVLLESYLEAGRQPYTEELGHIDPNISITDACISWNTTEKIIMEAASLRKSSTAMV
jgi:3-deoxy-7-phosphoheptulonate synthase